MIETTLVALYGLPVEVAFEPSALSSRTAVTRGDVRVELRLPQLPSDPESDRLKPPSIPGRPQRIPKIAQSWGTVAWFDGTIEAAFVTQVATTTRVVARSRNSLEDASRVASEQFVKTVDELWQATSEWVEVLTGQDLHPTSRPHHTVLSFTPVYYVADGHLRGLPLSSTWKAAHHDVSLLLNRRLWRAALRLAAESRRPPAGRLLMRNAQAALRRGQLRQAILEAGTSIEGALWELLLARHQAVPSGLGTALLTEARHWGLGRLRRVAEEAGIALPSSLTGGVIELRNRVAHREGHEPTYREAECVVRAASDLVRLVAPLPYETSAAV